MWRTFRVLRCSVLGCWVPGSQFLRAWGRNASGIDLVVGIPVQQTVSYRPVSDPASIGQFVPTLGVGKPERLSLGHEIEMHVFGLTKFIESFDAEFACAA